MIIKGLNEYDIVNYKFPSMYIAFPYCSFKCGRDLCQNFALAKEKDIDIEIKTIIDKYTNNPLTKAVVCGGLEPFDSFEDLFFLITHLRIVTNDDIVIYSGYEEDEILEKVSQLITMPNIVIKFGRYLPDKKNYFNEELGVTLASKNQYTVRYI